MLRYFAFSVRDFERSPDYSDYRLNWEIWIAFRGGVRPHFHDEPLRELAFANFWIMPPRLRFSWRTSTPKIERCVLHFAHVPAPLEQLARSREFFSRTLGAAELAEARSIATTVAAAQQRRDALSPLVYERALLDLTLLAWRGQAAPPLSTAETQVADRVDHAIAWYKEHLRDNPKLDHVARELHVSVSHLRRLFRVQLGKSPKAVFNKVRMEVATAIMANTRAPLKVAAEQSGFHSLADFSRVFKKHFGYPPNHWRRTSSQPLADVRALTPNPAGARRA